MKLDSVLVIVLVRLKRGRDEEGKKVQDVFEHKSECLWEKNVEVWMCMGIEVSM